MKKKEITLNSYNPCTKLFVRRNKNDSNLIIQCILVLIVLFIIYPKTLRKSYDLQCYVPQ